MIRNKTNSAEFSQKQICTGIYLLSFLVLIILFIVSVLGVSAHEHTYPTKEIGRVLVINDYVSLIIGVPVLALCLLLALRKKTIGWLLWPGALLFVLYNSLVYILTLPLSPVYLLHLFLSTFCVYALFGLFNRIDGEILVKKLAGAIPNKLVGGVLTGFGVLFLFMALHKLVTPVFLNSAIPITDSATYSADIVITFAWIIGGIQLWRGKPSGFIMGLGLLLQGYLLFLGLLLYFILQTFLVHTPFALQEFVVIAVFSLVFFIPFVLFMRGIYSKKVLD